MLMDSGSGGFEGAVGGMPLSDVIQLKAYNRFTGLISVEYRDQAGVIYFRNGEIVHAEQHDKMGEEAFYHLIRWPGGRFAMQDNVAAPTRTIENSVSYLLLEAHRLMDEENNPDGQQEPAAPAAPPKPVSVVEKLCRITGVTGAALLDASGKVLEAKGAEADETAATAFQLARSAQSLGDIFGVGSFSTASFQDLKRQILLFESKRHYLTVGADENATLSQVEADIRAALASRR